MISFFVLYSVILLILLFLIVKREYFTLDKFIIQSDSQFHGINLLGITNNDGFFPAANVKTCANYCAKRNDCKGFAFYQPGQRCYVFGSGNFVDSRPGFISGKKF